MAYKEKLAEHVREPLAEEDGVAEKKMFGGRARGTEKQARVVRLGHARHRLYEDAALEVRAR
jgi:hypothetical protein